MPTDTAWHDARSMPSVVNSMTKLLRAMAFNAYTVDFDGMANKRLAEKVIAYNLTADNREVDYLMALLDIDVPTGAVARLETSENMVVEMTTEINYDYNWKVDQVLTRHKRDRVFTLKSLPLNYLDLQKATFYEKCSICKKYGLLSICLLCGEMICSRKCYKPEKNEEISNVL